MDKDTKQGMSKAKGVTVESIAIKTKLSESKVRKSIKELQGVGFVDEAIKIVSRKCYYITELGVKELLDISKTIIGGM